MTLEYVIKDIDVNKTINQILNENFHFSARLYNKLVHNKYISLNSKYVDTRLIPSTGDILSVDLNYEEDNSNIVSTKMDLDILYEDDWLLILNKPAGIPVHPSIAHYESSLSNGVKFYFDSINLHKKIRPVNRIDLNTSGIIIFAKNEYIQECLIKQMNNKVFSKEYIAIVEGIFDKPYGLIDFPIARKENSIIKRCVSFENGQRAITEYEVLSNNQTYYSTLKCHLITGRTHQIRVHMAYIGHPLLGDTLYNPSYQSDKPHNLINRQALHSYCISFIHPISNLPIKIDCDLPDDMKSLVNL